MVDNKRTAALSSSALAATGCLRFAVARHLCSRPKHALLRTYVLITVNKAFSYFYGGLQCRVILQEA